MEMRCLTPLFSSCHCRRSKRKPEPLPGPSSARDAVSTKRRRTLPITHFFFATSSSEGSESPPLPGVPESPSPDSSDSEPAPPPDSSDSEPAPPPDSSDSEPDSSDSEPAPPPDSSDSSDSEPAPPPDSSDSEPAPPPDSSDSEPAPPPDSSDSEPAPPPDSSDSEPAPPPDSSDSEPAPPPDSSDSEPAPPPDSSDSEPAHPLDSSDSEPAPPPDSSDSEPAHPLDSSDSEPAHPLDSSDSEPAHPLDSSDSEPAPPPDSSDSEPAPPPDSSDSEPAPPPDSSDSEPAPPPDSSDSEPAHPLDSSDSEPAHPLDSSDSEPAHPLDSSDSEPAHPLDSSDSEPAPPPDSSDSEPDVIPVTRRKRIRAPVYSDPEDDEEEEVGCSLDSGDGVREDDEEAEEDIVGPTQYRWNPNSAKGQMSAKGLDKMHPFEDPFLVRFQERLVRLALFGSSKRQMPKVKKVARNTVRCISRYLYFLNPSRVDMEAFLLKSKVPEYLSLMKNYCTFSTLKKVLAAALKFCTFLALEAEDLVPVWKLKEVEDAFRDQQKVVNRGVDQETMRRHYSPCKDVISLQTCIEQVDSLLPRFTAIMEAGPQALTIESSQYFTRVLFAILQIRHAQRPSVATGLTCEEWKEGIAVSSSTVLYIWDHKTHTCTPAAICLNEEETSQFRWYYHHVRPLFTRDTSAKAPFFANKSDTMISSNSAAKDLKRLGMTVTYTNACTAYQNACATSQEHDIADVKNYLFCREAIPGIYNQQKKPTQIRKYRAVMCDLVNKVCTISSRS